MNPELDRRRGVRVPLQAACIVQSAGTRRVLLYSENVSRNGLLVRWNPAEAGPAPRIGGRVDVEIGLPENPVYGERFLAFRCTVVRISRTAEGDLLVALRSSGGGFRAAVRKLEHLQPVNALVH